MWGPPPPSERLVKAASLGNHERVVQLLNRGASPNAVHGPEEVTPLHMAAQQGSLEVVQELLQRGARPDARTTHGTTPLYIAALNGHVEVAAALLERLVAVDAPDHKGFTPLHAAAFQGCVPMTEQLLGAGCSVTAAGATGLTPLHLASRGGNHEAASLLLDRGAAVEASCQDGYTALHHASWRGHMEVVAVLLGANASLTAVTAKGRTALYLASSSGHTQVVQLLLANGADPFTPDGDGSLPLHVACRGNHMKTAARLLRGRRTPAHLNAPDGSSHTPLHLASKLGHAQMVALLLKAGADVDARTDTQRTPLHLAVRNGHTQVLEQLLAAGADPAALFESEGLANGLHVAALYNQPATLEVLLPAITAATGRGVVDVKYQGMTPLHWAVEKGHASCVKVLLEAGADLGEVYGAEAVSLEGVSLEGMSVLHRAVQLQYAAMVPLLATPRSMCCLWQGMTPLHWAVEKGHTSCVEALLAAGADPGEVCGEEAVSPDGVSLEGMSVLHRAVQLHNAAYVPLLATPRSMCCMWEGQTPLHCALRLGKPGLEMAQALVAARSPAGVVGGDGTTAMSLAGSSLVTAIRALLPGMVRNECWRYKRLQQGNEGQQQQQGVGQQQEPAAVLAAVVEGVSLLVRITTATGVEARTEPVAHCFQVVLDVLGGAVGGNLLQQVLNRLQRPPPTASSTSQHNHAVTLTLYRILHGRWLAELRPLIQMRGRVALRLQGLVTQPPQLPAQRQSRQQMLSNACSLPPATAQLKAQASAAAAAGKWPLFVQLLEQLEGLHSYSAYFVRSKVAHALVDGRALQPEGLCEALLGAWEAAQQDVASRTKRELADAVVGAVRVWQLRQKPRQQQPQQQVVAVEGGKRQRTGKARGR